MDQIKAPFTQQQIKKFNEYQNSVHHPYTCIGQQTEFEDENGRFQEYSRVNCPEQGVLIATEEGWVCPCGKYKQDFAHKFMAE